MPMIINHDDQLPQITASACIHLRSKSMYVHGTLGQTESKTESNAGACWCNTTQNSLGPDRDYVNRQSCVSGRECYRETH